jgi:hypothetical protein
MAVISTILAKRCRCAATSVEAITHARADWIALDGGALLLVLVGWALGATFALAGVVLTAGATFPQPKLHRAKRLQQAVFCFALAPLFSLGLPVFLDEMTRETRDVLADWAIVWAPAVAITCGLVVRRLGRRQGNDGVPQRLM